MPDAPTKWEAVSGRKGELPRKASGARTEGPDAYDGPPMFAEPVSPVYFHDVDEEIELENRILSNPLVPLWGFKEPEPLAWTVPRFIPDGYVTMLAADGGIGKSYFAIRLGVSLALGVDFLGLPVEKRRVLYVDYELDADEQKRRVARVMRGMGITQHDPRLAGRFNYYRPSGSLSTDEGHEEILAKIVEAEADLVILDSLTIGCIGADVSSARDIVSTMRRFREWGTLLVIDHISGNAASGNQSNARPFGSVFKRNIARSVFSLTKTDGGGLMLNCNKSNFGAPADLLCYKMDFDKTGDAVVFERIGLTHEAMAGALSNMKTIDVTLLAVHELYEENGGLSVTAEDVVQWREDHSQSIKKRTVQNHFTVLKNSDKIVNIEHGGVAPTSGNQSSRLHDPLDTVNREHGAGKKPEVPVNYYDDLTTHLQNFPIA